MEEAGRWTLMMKNMGNWSRLEKGNGMGGWGLLCCSRQQQMRTQGAQEAGFKSQDTGHWTQDTGQQQMRTQGGHKKQDSSHRTQDTRHKTQDSSR